MGFLKYQYLTQHPHPVSSLLAKEPAPTNCSYNPSISLPKKKKKSKEAMLRACHLPPIATPALCALRLSLIPSLHLSSPSNLHRASTLAPFQTSVIQTFTPTSPYRSPWSLKRVFPMHLCPKGAGLSFCQNP